MPSKFNSVNDLIYTFERMQGFQRGNRFEISITPPAGLNSPKTPFFASSIQIPTHVTQFYRDTMAPSAGTISVPIRRQYDELFKIDFIVDSNWEVRKFFEDWTDLIFPKNYITGKNALMVNYWNDICGTFSILALDENANTMRTITLNQAWPSTILPSGFNNDMPNNYLVLSVDIDYRNYTIS